MGHTMTVAVVIGGGSDMRPQPVNHSDDDQNITSNNNNENN